MALAIERGRVIDPGSQFDQQTNLYIDAGKILAIGDVAPKGFIPTQTIDASGNIVCPGLIDLRARLREPGHTTKGSIASETKAAAHSGITTLCCPPDTDPVTDTSAVIELITHRAAQKGYAKVLPIGALSQGLKGERISEMNALKLAGCVGISNAYKPVNSNLMRRAMEYASSEGLTVYLHAEDPTLRGRGVAHEGEVSTRLGLLGVPSCAETIAVARDLQLSELTGARTHFCNVSTGKAVQMIARAQYDGLPVTADVTAHHLFLTEMDIGYFNTQCNVRPPLRSEQDREALRAGVAQGTLSAIVSDHQPHDLDAKLAPFPSSEPGISALETLLPLTLRLVEAQLIDLPTAIGKLTHSPAQILGRASGSITRGVAADICIFDPEECWMLTAETMISQGHNSPFIGWEFKGRVQQTILAGNIVFNRDA